MLEKTADEFHYTEGHGPQPVAIRFGVTKKDGVISHLEDAGIGDSNFEDIRNSILV